MRVLTQTESIAQGPRALVNRRHNIKNAFSPFCRPLLAVRVITGTLASLMRTLEFLKVGKNVPVNPPGPE